ncbi:carbohydrate-binding protein [Galbibacter mesophilus]|uniref:hypothetical protein n=1 Tax=Galbibacter mesophilus TaxID=379069 RepID=UPI001F5DB101|nr:hypothetical protein [Galbibacter mesophilus]MCM5662192.1 hypothetical protein [Galbibacter mesophilus]
MKKMYTSVVRLAGSSFLLLFLAIALHSCSSDNEEILEEEPEASIPEPEQPQAECNDVSKYVFQEKDGLIKVEFENAIFGDDWELGSSEENYSGEGYMVWTGNDNLGTPGVGKATFKINIKTPGVYQLLWNSAVTIGDNGTEHNDTWLRFDDADDFFGKKGESFVYPKDRNKSPNPKGASKDGWFKIYRSGNDLGFKWQARTSDHDAHDIFIQFDNPGIYTMEVSARSKGHAIDAFVLFKEGMDKNEAVNTDSFSEISCD